MTKPISSEAEPPCKWMDKDAFKKMLDHYNAIAKSRGYIELSPAFIESVMFVESKGDPAAVSPSDARGLMQVKAGMTPHSGQLGRDFAFIKEEAKDAPGRGFADGLGVFLQKAASLEIIAEGSSKILEPSPHGKNAANNLYLLTLGYKAGTAGLRGDFEALKLREEKEKNLVFPPKVAAYAQKAMEEARKRGDDDRFFAFLNVKQALTDGAERVGIQDFQEQIEAQYIAYSDRKNGKPDFDLAFPPESAPVIAQEKPPQPSTETGHGLPSGLSRPTARTR